MLGRTSVFAIALTLLVAWTLVFSSSALAQETCSGCRVSLPAGHDRVPLIVTLHGDYQAASIMHDAWKRMALSRGIGLLSLACPASKGCGGSYWKWDGAPSWVLEQVTKIEKSRDIDHDRLWLVGWSGGASYIGYRAQAFEHDFAAIVIHGGGMAPADSTCATEKTPVYFLVGDKNPYHSLAKNLRDHFTRCGSDVTWDLLPNAEHDGEWAALTTHGAQIMTWLLAHPRKQPAH